MMISWKGFGRKRSRPNFKVLSRHSPRGTEENTKILNQDSRSPGPRIEPGTIRIRSRNVNYSTTTFGSKSKAVPLFALQSRMGRGGIAPTHS
jgi:hypothetical protein